MREAGRIRRLASSVDRLLVPWGTPNGDRLSKRATASARIYSVQPVRLPAAGRVSRPGTSTLVEATSDQGPPGCSEMETHCARNAVPHRRPHAVGLPAK